MIEDWAAQVFQVLLYNLGSPDQKAWIYEAVGLDPAWCQQAFMEAITDAGIREDMQEATNIFRVLIKTLLKAGIITDRTRACMRPISTWPNSMPKATAWSATTSPKKASNI